MTVLTPYGDYIGGGGGAGITALGPGPGNQPNGTYQLVGTWRARCGCFARADAYVLRYGCRSHTAAS